MKALDAVAWIAPGAAARWLRNWRLYRLERDASRAYDAVQSGQWREIRKGSGSGNASLQAAGTRLREIARYIDENVDLGVGLFDDIINNAVGNGLMLAPGVRNSAGELLERFNREVTEAWAEWADAPETSGTIGWEQVQRLVARSYLRDGEAFAVKLTAARGFRYRTPVPFVLELLEADYCPLDGTQADQQTFHGIRLDQWGAPVEYLFYSQHPGDPFVRLRDIGQLRRVSADNVQHIRFSRRLRQLRGVPIIHAIINRLRDLQDYEESERIAAKVAADMTAFIERTSEFNAFATDVNDAKNRTLEMSAGQIYTLLPGEKVSTIKSERPNTALADFRNAMLRAVAAGAGARFSSLAKDYNGTYSAQRQELVEGATAYRVHTAHLVRAFHKPVYREWLTAAIASGRLRVPRDATRASLYRCDFRPPALPWIDPLKEAQAWQVLIQAGIESRAEIIRQRGRDPDEVMREIEQETAIAGAVTADMVDAGSDALTDSAKDNADAGTGTDG
ncbi:MAG: phage portal protein [Planctomycetota bacterium]|nr:MAG: phage portal protein [Planctomycetota bacterium]